MMRHMRNNYIEHRTSLYYYIPEFSMEFSNRRVSNRRVVITQRQHTTRQHDNKQHDTHKTAGGTALAFELCSVHGSLPVRS